MIKLFLIFIGFLSVEHKELKVNTEKTTISWEATKVIGDKHTGNINVLEGTLFVENEELQGGSFVIDMTSLVCTDLEGKWKNKLETHLRSDDFFDVKRYSTSSLLITSVSKNNTGGYKVIGELTIKGKTEITEFDAFLEKDKNNYKATAKIVIDRTQFDIKYGSDTFFDNLGDKAISNNFTLNVSLLAGSR